MNTDVLEKPISSENTVSDKPGFSLSIADQTLDFPATDTDRPRSWEMDLEPEVKHAIDDVMNHLIVTGARPQGIAVGGLIDILTTLSNTLSPYIPEDLAERYKIMLDYTTRWLADYMEATKTVSMKVSFGFETGLAVKEGGQS